jgi:hypothetical protein
MCASCPLRVTVENGEVVAVMGRGGQCSVPDHRSAPTIEDVFAMEEADRSAETTDSFEVHYDPLWGFPASVSIRCPYGTSDCGTSYDVTDFQPQR